MDILLWRRFARVRSRTSCVTTLKKLEHKNKNKRTHAQTCNVQQQQQRQRSTTVAKPVPRGSENVVSHHVGAQPQHQEKHHNHAGYLPRRQLYKVISAWPIIPAAWRVGYALAYVVAAANPGGPCARWGRGRGTGRGGTRTCIRNDANDAMGTAQRDGGP